MSQDDPGFDWRLQKGAAIKAAREARHKSQAAVAEAIGVNVSTISEIERGVTVPKLTTIEAIADFLGLTIDAVIGRAPLPMPQAVDLPESLSVRLDDMDRDIRDALRAARLALAKIRTDEQKPAATPRRKRGVGP